ncbi:diacylglycerol/lipid kinase family protein [Polyangium jinanense]|uniref:Sphingosine kinase n=1 Tax=Polyangium jinanense TaxID=2829994 RepID=A0A9X4ATA9_9BACT|nr:diacylglycerol kinase family protein [Polyangium jinanense]MDC3958304.1 sphingosine kinase [Polyangium jinanense]MDC3983361.1 sphingosine kinase [Polyangium jinanense]
MGGIGVVLNPRSRQNRRDPAAASRLARTLGDRGVVRTARTREDLARIAEDFRKLKIDVLGISGGDGTNHITLTGFLEVYSDEPLPPIAFLRGGTMNTVANAVGVPRGKPDGLLAALIARYNERGKGSLQVVERSTMRINDHYGFIFGTGAIHGYMAEYYRHPEPNPVHAASTLYEASKNVLLGLKTPVAERWEGSVELSGGVRLPMRDYLCIAAGTVDQIGLGFRPFYRSGHVPGRFHILGIHTTALGFVKKLPDIWQARPMGEEHTYDHLAEHAILEARSGVVRYVLDGDLHEQHGPLEMRVGPRVQIVVAHKAGIRPPGGSTFAFPPPWIQPGNS